MSDDELDSIREKRKRELLAQTLKKELEQKKLDESKKKIQEREIRATMIVNQVLEPDAIIYLDWLSKNNPTVAQTIKETIILILHKNLLRNPISKVDLIKIERQITGQESSIMVKRRGQEKTNLDEKLKKDKKIVDN